MIGCNCCNKVYIGETCRRLKTRIAEHKRDCETGNNKTGLSQHAWNNNHFFNFNYNNIKILAREKISYKRKFFESIFIKKHLDICVNLQSERWHINNYYHCILN